MATQYIIYCDESKERGRFYSNFYGGALIEARDREDVEKALELAKEGITGEAKWTKVTQQDEDAYIRFALKFLELTEDGIIKARVMFTQNVHNTDHVRYEPDAKYRKLYYQFIKHAFGLMFCNSDRNEVVQVAIYLDAAPDTAAHLNNFKNYLADLMHANA